MDISVYASSGKVVQTSSNFNQFHCVNLNNFYAEVMSLSITKFSFMEIEDDFISSHIVQNLNQETFFVRAMKLNIFIAEMS